MLKFSICTGVRTFTILLLIVAVAKAEQYNIHTVNFPMCYNYRMYCDYQKCAPLQNATCSLPHVTRVLGNFMNAFLNGTCVYNSLSLNTRFGADISNITDELKKLQKLIKTKLKYVTANSRRKIIPSFWRNTSNHHVNDMAAFSNIVKGSITETRKNQGNHIGYKWKRRTLCAVADKQKYSFENLEKKTLMDYDGSDFMNDIDDPDSLKTHIRVKRNKPELDSVSRFMYQQDYLKDLANSFPQNAYDSMDENAYDDDVSLDTKREIKTHEFLTEDEHINDPPDERLKSEAVDVEPIAVPAFLNNDKSPDSEFINAPSDAIQENHIVKSNLKFGDQTESQRIAAMHQQKDVPITNQQSYNNFQEQNLPEDSMLAVELVRKKRNGALKVHDEGDLEIDASPELQTVIDQSENSPERTSVSESEKSEDHENPRSIISANLKADLMRIRRKAKERNRRGKNSKEKKKKKHAGKKHNVRRDSQRPAKDVRQKNTAQLARERKKNEASNEGKSKVGIARVVSKKNNGNNFRRRSEKPKKSNVRTHSEKERSTKSVESARHGKFKRGTEDKVETANTKVSLTHGRWPTGNDDTKAGINENVNAPATQDEKQLNTINEGSVNSVDVKTSRSKKDKGANHGFTNKEDELKYYENIREPGSELDLRVNHDANQLSLDNEMESNRAVRSIEEVKALAKQLMTKVNELQTYLNIEQAENNDKQVKKIETRAIDDLCSNVSTACDAYKASPRIVQKCVPSTNHDSAVKIAEKKVNSIGITGDEKYAKGPDKNPAEKKRSLGSRVVKISPNAPKRIRKEEPKSNHKWGKWTDWSSCSVTCGKGRQIRWRYCLRDCSTAETEMEEKACQLPACPPGKFLGIF